MNRAPVPRRWLFRVGMIAATALAGLGAGEAWFRTHALRDAVYVPDLLYARPPGWDGAGWREGVDPPPRKPDQTRIVCVGDSVTEGLGLATPAAWPHQLRGVLGPGHHEVFNFAIAGWTSEQVVTLLETRIPAWKPDLVVWGTYANDIFPTRMIYGEDGLARWVSQSPPEVGALLPGPLARWLIPRSSLYRLLLPVTYRAFAGDDPPMGGGSAWYAHQVARLEAWRAETKIPVVILAIPPHVLLGACPADAPCAELAAWYDTLTGVLAKAGLPWVDGRALLAGTGPYFQEGTRDFEHPNGAGQAALAQIVAPAVRAALGEQVQAGEPRAPGRPHAR